MKSIRCVLVAFAVLALAMPVVADELPEPTLAEILFGDDTEVTVDADVENEASELEALEPEIEAVTSSGEAPPVSFYLTSRCGGWSYAGCCGSQRKYRRSCYIVELPWETWTETKCQNTCVL